MLEERFSPRAVMDELVEGRANGTERRHSHRNLFTISLLLHDMIIYSLNTELIMYRRLL